MVNRQHPRGLLRVLIGQNWLAGPSERGSWLWSPKMGALCACWKSHHGLLGTPFNEVAMGRGQSNLLLKCGANQWFHWGQKTQEALKAAEDPNTTLKWFSFNLYIYIFFLSFLSGLVPRGNSKRWITSIDILWVTGSDQTVASFANCGKRKVTWG